ncbi:MAG: sugar kinase [Acidiferrobacterales bacterium]|nr:sugar kinase [Acidiferrobacterales bacterium]
MANLPSIAVLGECMLELNAPSQRNASSKIACNLSYGGDSLNTSVYLARLGSKVSYVTALGDDSLSDWMIAQWQAEGVDCGLVHRMTGDVPGMYLIELDEFGERSFKYWRKNSPASQWLNEQEKRQSVFAQLLTFDYVYLSGISIAILPEDIQKNVIEFLHAFRSRGGKIIFDGNYRANLWRDSNSAAKVYEAIYQNCDIALPTLEDEQAIFNDAHSEAALNRFQGYGIDCIALKMGESGCTFVTDEESKLVPAYKVEVVDTTSAGDAFNAGFIDAILNSQNTEQACVAGHKLASVVIQHKGAIIPASEMPQI